MEKFVIAISRRAGSGGTPVGKILAKEYGINLYDKEIMKMASEDSGINEALFAKADEKVKNSLLYKVSKRVYNGELIPPASGNFTSDQNLFNYQAKVLKELAANESYVVIGRAADFVLKDVKNVIKVFLYADEEFCVQQEALALTIEEKEARKLIKKLDKERDSYHSFYTGLDRNDCSNYDICLDTGKLGFEKTAQIIKNYVDIRLSEK